MQNPTFLDPIFFDPAYVAGKVSVFAESLQISAATVASVVPYVKTVFMFVVAITIAGIAYALVRLWEVRQAEAKKFHFAEPVEASVRNDGHERWQVVQNHINSENPADWRLAIIEADAILDEIVKKMGYHGENLGDRLKAVEVSDFNSIQSAWEAHKVRNKIAHEGSGFALNAREARRIIGLYEEVFREFNFI